MSGDNDDDWGGCAVLLLLAAGGYWWFHSNTSAPALPKEHSIISPSVASPPAVNIAPAIAAAPPTEPKRNYDFEEKGTYGYIAALSDNELKEGKAAGDVLLLRYAGIWDGKIHIEQVSPTGGIAAVSECPRNCKAIRTWRNGKVSLVAYNPSSIIGAAFEDALAGRLIKYREPAPRFVPSPTQGYGPEPEGSLVENAGLSEPNSS